MRTTHLKTLIITTLLALAASLIPAQAQRFSIFNTNHTWTYMASTTAGFCLNGTGWEQELFDDSTWPSGPGGFTGGETAAASLLGVTTTTLPAPTPSGGAPQYFRAHFNLASSANVSLILSNRIDDQAVIYINGIRMADYRHPTDPESCTAAGAGGDEATVWIVITLTPAQLAPAIHDGDNVVAVSVHQNAPGSSDMVFVMTMSGEIAFPPVNCGSLVNSSTNVLQCHNLNLTACFDGGPAPTIQWKKDGVPIDSTVNPTATNATLVLTNLQSGDAGVYQAMATNPSGMASSAQTMVTVQADGVGPVLLSAVGGMPGQADDLNSITLTFDEPILPNAGDPTQADGYDAANVEVTPLCGGDAFFGLFSFGAVLVAPNQVVIQTDTPRVAGERYRVHLIVGAGLKDQCVGNPVLDTMVDICVSTEFQDDLNGYLGTHDTELRGGNAQNATPQGNAVTVNVDNADGAPAAPSDALIRFDNIIGNGPGQVPPNATIRSVQLVLTSTAANSDTPDQVEVHRMLQTWDEDTATYDLFVNGVAADNVEASTTIDAMFNHANATLPFTVTLSTPAMTATVQAWVNNPADNHGWALIPTGGNGYRFQSSEDPVIADRPHLIVCYTVPQSAIVITRQPPAMVMVNEGQTIVVDVENSGSDARYTWRRNGTPVPAGPRVSGENTARLSITGAVPGDAGNYDVVISNCFPSRVTSTATAVQVKSDTTPPSIVAVCGLTNLDCILVTFNEQVGQASAENIANYSLAGLTVISATLTNGTNVVLKTTTRTPGQNYTLQSSGVRDLSAAMNASLPASITIAQFYVVFTWDKVWSYEQNANLDGTGWEQPSYDDSAWPAGAGLLGLETTAGTIALLPTFNTALTVSTNQPTYYFRTKFDFPFDTAGVTFDFEYPIDDGGVVHLNGGVAFVHNMTNQPISSINYNTLAAVTETEGVIYRTNLNVLPGENLLAVDVHQVSLTSSDIVWGGQLTAKVSQFRAACPRPHIVLVDPNQNPPRQVVIEWGATGALQGANDVEGPYSDIGGATSPFTTSATGGFKYYRVRCNN